jgi:hypothetical protein
MAPDSLSLVQTLTKTLFLRLKTIKLTIPIKPYHMPPQPPTKKLRIMIAILIKGKSTIPILMYLSYLLSGSILFEKIDAITINTVTPWKN